jgi:hypothetical protein
VIGSFGLFSYPLNKPSQPLIIGSLKVGLSDHASTGLGGYGGDGSDGGDGLKPRLPADKL